ncbi:MAG: zinc ribbon domain-containing protein [Actinobacteria bacterium]|nr:zinc ribbon domain-containing protein [Actinomycetota bacterium]
MQCKNCGSNNPDTNNYCGNCGAPLGSASTLHDLMAAGFLKAGDSITCKVKGEEVDATILEDGRVQYGDKTYDTPFLAIEGIRGYRCDSWSCWKARGPEGKVKPLHLLRVAMAKGR